MGWLDLIFGVPKKKTARAQVDWSSIDAEVFRLNQLASTKNQADAKQLIIQMDNLVDRALKQLVEGQTMGERMKTIKFKLDRQTYDHLWKAHLKRNELVHEAGSFVSDWELQTYFAYFKQALNDLRVIK